MSKIRVRFGVVALLIFVAALSRVLPHPYNFSPLVGIALFGGSQFSKRWQAYLVPLAAYFISDLIFTLSGKVGFYGISQLFVYGAMVLVTALGTTLNNPKALKIAGYSLTGSAIFWIISNFGVWVGSQVASSIEHEPGLSLAATYIRALPFYNTVGTEMFVNAFAGDLFYSIVLFGVFALMQKRFPALVYARA